MLRESIFSLIHSTFSAQWEFPVFFFSSFFSFFFLSLYLASPTAASARTTLVWKYKQLGFVDFFLNKKKNFMGKIALFYISVYRFSAFLFLFLFFIFVLVILPTHSVPCLLFILYFLSLSQKTTTTTTKKNEKKERPI